MIDIFISFSLLMGLIMMVWGIAAAQYALCFCGIVITALAWYAASIK